ncbi:MAG: hypothetical protein AAF197_10170 [Pseudomonadota bacterium]
MNKNRRIRFDSKLPVSRGELFTYLVSEGTGAGLSQKELAHLTGLLPRDIKMYSHAEPEDIEDNVGRAILARSLNAYPELYDYLSKPTFDFVMHRFKQYFSEITQDDIAVLIGATKQNAKRWVEREKTEPKSPVFLRNMRNFILLTDAHGEAAAKYWVACVLREYTLLGKVPEFSPYLQKQASDILASQEFLGYEDSLFASS